MNKTITNVVMTILIIFKSFFIAVTQVAWGLVSLFGLNLLLTYLLREGQVLPSSLNYLFIKLEGLILNHIMVFVIVFFLVYLYFELKELLKRDDKQSV